MRTLIGHHGGGTRPYAAAAVAGGTVWVCGQVPVAADGSTPDRIGDQVRVTLDNLETVLHSAGARLATLVKLTAYLADLAEFDHYNTAYLQRLSGLDLPPRTTVEVAGFRGAKRIEIDAVAAVSAPAS